jgi:hypothetical protein
VPTQLPAGPYRTLRTPEGATFPYYIIPFDKDGNCTGPQTRAHLLANLGDVTDLFLFSHGWNNDWSAATERYDAFITGFQRVRTSHNLAMPAGYKPLLVGIFWPSQSLTIFESETGPGFAAAGAQDAAVAASQAMLSDIASELPAASRARFHVLASASELNEAESRELAAMLSTALGGVSDAEAGSAAAPSADDLLAAAVAITAPDIDVDEVGTVGGGARAADPLAAGGIGGLLRKLDPRNLLKPFTVWQMKDRAGKIGAAGVGPLLHDILSATTATRVHLLGHSYGCKVVMTATCTMPAPPRKVESALLLQPAISQYAFAESVPEMNVPGGFHSARARVAQPITATFSTHDTALHTLFHLSVRRAKDLGELQYAGDDPPSKFAAMGGYGPQATANSVIIPIRNAGQAYTLPATSHVVGINGSRVIDGHGGILKDDVWYLSWSLATAHMRS